MGFPNYPSGKLYPGFEISLHAREEIDALHLNHDPLFAITIPSKTQFYLAMGKPILIDVSARLLGFSSRPARGSAPPPRTLTRWLSRW